MDECQLIDEIAKLSRSDDWYQQCLRDVNESEPDFCVIREALPEVQQLQLDRYIAACENLEHAKLFLAYEIGRRHPVYIP